MTNLLEPIIGSEYPKKVIPLINVASSSIDIIVYDWRWYGDNPGHAVQLFNAALVRAAQRGVQVRAILNTDLIIPTLNKVGIKARRIREKRTLHTKLMLIDRKIAIIGSHNFTKNAFGSNLETSVVVDIPEEHTRLFEFFNNLWMI